MNTEMVVLYNKTIHNNIFPTPDSKFPGKAEFDRFLVNHTNRIRHQQLVKDQLQHYHQTHQDYIF